MIAIVMEGVNKSNHPTQNPLLFVTEPRTRDNMKIQKRGSDAGKGGYLLV
jgi:hypothetical protein